MKIAIITDQHFGCRKNSKLFHDYFLKFYNDIFFPYLEEHGITTVIDMGDTFDSRKGIDFSSLAWAKDNYYDRLKSMGIHVHTIVGNHTAYYKNTNEVNAVDLLLREYDNVTVYSEATEVSIDKLNVLFIPWINKENEESTFKLIKSSVCKIAMGHLELNGFRAIEGASWIMVIRASYIQSSPRSSAVTTTLDRMMDGSTTWEIRMRCSGTMSVIGEDSPSLIQKLLNIFQ